MKIKIILAGILCSVLLLGCFDGSESDTTYYPDGEFSFSSDESFHSAKLAVLLRSLIAATSEPDAPQPNELQQIKPYAGEKFVSFLFKVSISIISSLVNKKLDKEPSHYESVIAHIEGLSADITLLQSDIATISANLYKRHTLTDLRNAETSLINHSYIPISNAYSEGLPYSLKYFAQMEEAIAKMPDITEDDKLAKDRALNNVALKIPDYQREVTYTNSVQTAFNGISEQILPKGTISPGILKLFANALILDYKSNGTLSVEEHKRSVMQQYIRLENYFSLMLYRQHQATEVLTNIIEYQNQLDINKGFPVSLTVEEWVTNTYAPLLKQELQEFLDVTNYLVTNLYDYRNIDGYKRDMKFQTTGLAPDDINIMVLARSRFIYAQIINLYNKKKSGLVGTIILPYDYTKGQSITLRFKGVSESNNFYDMVSAPITPKTITGRYPYTQWVDNTLTRGNQWLTYGIDFPDQNMPTGEYKVFVADHGTSDSWVHVDNEIGKVRVAYYNADYNGQKPETMTSTFTADEKHTIKFGFFAYKWPWNYQKLTSLPKEEWITTKKTMCTATIGGSSKTYEEPSTLTLTNHTNMGPNHINMMNINLQHPKNRYTDFNTTFDIRSFAFGIETDSDARKQVTVLYTSPGDVVYINHEKAGKKSKIGYNYKLYEANTKFTDLLEIHSHEKSLANAPAKLTHYTTDPVDVWKPYTMKKGTEYRLRVSGFYLNKVGNFYLWTEKRWANLGMDIKWNMQILFTGQDDHLL